MSSVEIRGAIRAVTVPKSVLLNDASLRRIG
jgi:hypothetical protein